MSSCIGQSPRYSPGKPILEEWYDCIYIYINPVDCGWQKMKKSKGCVTRDRLVGVSIVDEGGRVSRFENEPVKNSITRVEGTRRVQGRKWGRVFWLIGPRGNRLEIGYYYPVNAVTVATNRTFNHLRYRTPRDEIAFQQPSSSSLSFDVARLSCSISPHGHCFSFVNLHFLPCPTLDFRYESCESGTNLDYRFASNTPCVSTIYASLSSINGEHRVLLSKKNSGTGYYFHEF